MSRSQINLLRGKLVNLVFFTLLTLAIGAGAVLLTNAPARASSSPHFSISRTYYSNPAKTDQVGFLTCDCHGTENLVWGQATPYFTERFTGFCPSF